MSPLTSSSPGARSPRVAFLFFDHIHHVYHTASIAFELARSGADVRLFTSTASSLDLLREIAERYDDVAVTLERLEPSAWHRLLTRLKGRRPYPRAKFVIDRNADRLLDADAVVTPDFYALHLLERRSGADPRFVRVFHGAGDRNYGVDDRLTKFDLVLIPGPKFQRRIDAFGRIGDAEVEIVGYPKFDVCAPDDVEPVALFPEDRPTVVYAPHFEPSVSSWHAWGSDVLEFFYASDRYNLIFAPHIMLFAKKNPRHEIAARYYDAPHIHVDPGSLASVDMTYTNAADIYLGDVSSQVYEFVAIEPRPCVFLDPHGTDWEGDLHYLFWTLGDVATSLDEFERLFETPPVVTEEVRETHLRLLDDTFEIDHPTPPGVRAAEAILAHLDRG